MKKFTLNDVEQHGAIANAGLLYADRTELVNAPLDWQKAGLTQTASGYGAKLTTHNKIHFEGKLFRLYATCYGNSASVWFKFKGQTIFVH